jgi:hypothetical protein
MTARLTSVGLLALLLPIGCSGRPAQNGDDQQTPCELLGYELSAFRGFGEVPFTYARAEAVCQ